MQGSHPMVRFLLTVSFVVVVVVLAAACNSVPGPEVSPGAVDFGSLESGEIGYGLVELWHPGEQLEIRVLVQPSTGIFSTPSAELLTLDPGSLTAEFTLRVVNITELRCQSQCQENQCQESYVKCLVYV